MSYSPRLLSVPQAADQLGLSPKTVWSWVYQRRIGVVRLGRSVKISQAAIDELIHEGTIPAQVPL